MRVKHQLFLAMADAQQHVAVVIQVSTPWQSCLAVVQSFSLDADESVNALSEQAGDHSVQTLLDDALLTLTQVICK